MSGGFRVSIPAGVRKTIQNIKEIAGNHSDEEVYAMLKECSMDPNETAQKLLLQDTFHEVKRRRDKKESNKEPTDSRRRPGMQVQGGRGGRGNFSMRYSSDVGGRKLISGKENGLNQTTDKANTCSPLISLSTESKTSGAKLLNGPSNLDHTTVRPPQVPSSVVEVEESSASEGQVLHSKTTQSSISGVSLALDPMLVPSEDAHNSSDVSTIKHAVGCQCMVGEMPSYKVASRDLPTGFRETSQSPSSSHGWLTGNRPSSSYSNRSQQFSGPQKAAPSKEWKPKSTSVNAVEAPVVPVASGGVVKSAQSVAKLLSTSCSISTEEATLKGKKLNDLQLSDRQHVIIPNHLRVPDTENYGLSFGSFDASFEQSMGIANDPMSEKTTAPSEIESSQEFEETVEETTLSFRNSSLMVQGAAQSGHQQSPGQMPEEFSPDEVDKSSDAPVMTESNQPTEEVSLAPEGPQYSIAQTAPSFSKLGLVPNMLGNQFVSLETSEPQAREAGRLPNLMVQQPFDMSTSYYTQLYRPTADADGHFSPFLPTGAIKYDNISVLPAQAGQAAQEGGNSLVLSSSGSTTLATQAAGTVRSYIAVPQQPVPVFRQPVGLHISHYPPNYIPYNQYISPFYAPTPTIHHFLNNAAFPQHPSIGTICPSPGVAAVAAPVKYPVSQYKPGANSSNPTNVGMPTGYGTCSSNPAGYTSNSSVTSGNSGENDYGGASQFKENNVFISGQQSEGSAVWIQAPGRDVSGLQVSSFYGLSPQGHHMTFAPAQAGHSAFGGIYHPAQTIAAAAIHPLLQQSQTVAGGVEMVGPPASVFQQQQRAQINWTNNY